MSKIIRISSKSIDYFNDVFDDVVELIASNANIWELSVNYYELNGIMDFVYVDGNADMMAVVLKLSFEGLDVEVIETLRKDISVIAFAHKN